MLINDIKPILFKNKGIFLTPPAVAYILVPNIRLHDTVKKLKKKPSQRRAVNRTAVSFYSL